MTPGERLLDLGQIIALEGGPSDSAAASVIGIRWTKHLTAFLKRQLDERETSRSVVHTAALADGGGARVRRWRCASLAWHCARRSWLTLTLLLMGCLDRCLHPHAHSAAAMRPSTPFCVPAAVWRRALRWPPMFVYAGLIAAPMGVRGALAPVPVSRRTVGRTGTLPLAACRVQVRPYGELGGAAGSRTPRGC